VEVLVVVVDRARQQLVPAPVERRRVDAERAVREALRREVGAGLAGVVARRQRRQRFAVVIELRLLHGARLCDALGAGKQTIQVIEAAILGVDHHDRLDAREVRVGPRRAAREREKDEAERAQSRSCVHFAFLRARIITAPVNDDPGGALPDLRLQIRTGGFAMRIAVPLLLAVSLAACAYRPVVDPKTSRHPGNYETDLAECRQLAEQGAHPGGSAAGGALVGAGVGAAFAVATGHKDAVGPAAGGGAVLGGAKGAGAGANEQHAMVRNCMKGRGYAVLN